VIPPIVTAILLSIPLITMVIPSIIYWLEFKDSKKSGDIVKKAGYKKLFFYLGVLDWRYYFSISKQIL
jgi:hypothetical protein